MRLRLHRLGFALWLGLLALTASGVAQNQLSTNVLVAALDTAAGRAPAGHYMPDGTFMAGSMSGMSHADHHSDSPDAGGHTHKGHADCSMCGVVASMAALSVPVLDAILVPDVFAKSLSKPGARSVVVGRHYAPYSSRAPPHLIG